MGTQKIETPGQFRPHKNEIGHSGRAALTRHPSLFASYLGSLATLAVGLVAQFAGYAVLARYLGASEFGVLMTISAATAVGYCFCGLGSSDTALRRIARNRADYSQVLGHSLVLTGISGAVTTVLVAIGLALWVKADPQPAKNLLIMIAFSFNNIVFLRIVSFAECVFLAHLQNAYANLLNTAFNLVRGVTTLVACIGFGASTIADWVAAYVVVNSAFAAICLVLLFRIGSPKWIVLRDEFWLGIHFITPWFFNSLRQNIGILVLNLVAPTAVIGTYGVSQRAVDASRIVSSSFNRIFYASLAVAGAAGAKHALRITLKRLAAIFGLSLATSTGIFVAAPWIPTIFGQGFEDTVLYLRLLCLLPTLYAIQVAAYDALGGADQHRIRAAIYNSGAIFGATLAATLAYSHGVMGLIGSLYVSETITTIALWLTLDRLAATEPAID